MSRPSRRWRGPGWVKFLFFYLGITGLTWMGFHFFLTWIGPSWSDLVRGETALGSALVTDALLFWVWGRLTRRGRFGGQRHPDFLSVFNEAFQRISQGDYRVQIPVDDQHQGGPAGHFQSLAQNLNAMADSLARVEDLRKQFVADVSHEFQSPLTSILGFAQALKSPGLDEARRLKYLGIIETEARRLSRLSDNLLKLNTLEDRQEAPDRTLFRLDVQLRRVLVALEPLWAAKNLVVEADLVDFEMTGNEGLWTQVWTNLVQNAVKFTPAGGSITVRIVPGTPGAVEVQDTGIGLAPDQLPRIFERFYKADASRSSAEGSGSGLGLALVQRIVTLHGGQVEAQSPGLGQGCTLRVTLPGLNPGT